MKKKNTIFKIIITMLLIVIFNTSSLLAENVSNEKTHWASDMLQEWQNNGILVGDSFGSVKIDEKITKVEAITILNRINNVEIEIKKDDARYKDVEAFRWYYGEVEKAIATGILSGEPDGNINPKDNITREQAFSMIAKLFNISYGTKEEAKAYLKTVFSDGEKIAGWSSPSIAGLYKDGYINGFKDNTIRAKEYITRAEFVKVLDNMIKMLISKPGEYDLSEVEGIVVINVNGVTITAVNENTKLYLTAGTSEEVNFAYEEQIEEEKVPESVLIGSVSSNIDYTVFNPTSEEIAKKKLNELKILYGMPNVEAIKSITNMQYYGRVKGTDAWNELILKVSNEENVDPVFVKCIMTFESGGKAGIRSKQNTNGTYDYGLMQVNSGWGSSFNYNRMLTDNEYAIRCGIIVIKRKIEAAEKSKKTATVHEVAWRYNGYSSKGYQYANKLSALYEELSGKSRYTLVRTTKNVVQK